MEPYIHAVPGRFRIKLAAIKGNESRARQVCRQMETREGVLSVRSNTLTGSLLVHYDVRQLNPATLLAALEQIGFLKGRTERPIPSQDVPNMELGPRATDASVNKLMASMVERSAAALLAALI